MRVHPTVIARLLILPLSLFLITCRLYQPINVSATTLFRSPNQYRDQFIVVEGRNNGSVGRLACLSSVSPPGNYLLQVPATDLRPDDAYQNIYVTYTPTQEQSYALDYPVRTRVTIRGWWRYYDGPGECGGRRVQRWYLEADEVRFIDPLPQRPTDLPHLSGATATPSLPENTPVLAQ